MKPRYIVISTPVMVENGTYSRYTLDKAEALEWVRENEPDVVSPPMPILHDEISFYQCVRVLGIEPKRGARDICHGYSEAMVIMPKTRLEFGRDYSVKEVEKIGLNYLLIIYEGEL